MKHSCMPQQAYAAPSILCPCLSSHQSTAHSVALMHTDSAYKLGIDHRAFMSVSLCLLEVCARQSAHRAARSISSGNCGLRQFVVLLVRGVMTLTSSTNGGQHEHTHNFVQICLQTSHSELVAIAVATFLKRGAYPKADCAQSAPVSSV